MKKKTSISKKILASLILFIVIVTASICIIGYSVSKRVISKLYNDTGYIVGEMILGELNTEAIEYFVTTWEKNGYYPVMERFLKRVEEESKAKYIYIVVPNEDNTMTYVYDSSGMELGESDPMSAHSDKALYVYNTGERISEYFVRHSKKYGYLTSSVLPIKSNSGKVLALLFVDTNMEVIEETLFKFVSNVVLVATFLMIIFSLVYWKYTKGRIIAPLNVIQKCTKRFVENDVLVTEELNDIKQKDEIGYLSQDILNMEKDIVKYIEDLRNFTSEREKIAAELSVGTKIQSSMLPKLYPKFVDRSDIKLNASMDPAKEVGGDFYDFFFVDDERVALVCADVSGKGVPAALFMVIAKTMIKNFCMMGFSPAEVLEKTNEHLCESNDASMFVTVWCAIFNTKTGEGVASNAGHEHPLIKRKDGVYEFQRYRHDVAVAIMSGFPFTEHEFKLFPGDKLFIYTDGVSEATNQNKEFFGEERLEVALNKYKDLDPLEALPALKNEIDSFVGDSPQFDDITMLMVEYLGN